MDAAEPRVRRRGFFLHSSTDEAETGEYENPEGFVVRVRFPRSSAPRHVAASGTRETGGRSRHASRTSRDETQPEIRSGSATGSRQRAHLPR